MPNFFVEIVEDYDVRVHFPFFLSIILCICSGESFIRIQCLCGETAFSAGYYCMRCLVCVQFFYDLTLDDSKQLAFGRSLSC